MSTPKWKKRAKQDRGLAKLVGSWGDKEKAKEFNKKAEKRSNSRGRGKF